MGQRDRGVGENIFRREKTGEGIGDTSSWGVESTQEFRNPTEELRNCQWGSWAALTVVLQRRGGEK
jgi:hypothetical protein